MLKRVRNAVLAGGIALALTGTVFAASAYVPDSTVVGNTSVSIGVGISDTLAYAKVSASDYVYAKMVCTATYLNNGLSQSITFTKSMDESTYGEASKYFSGYVTKNKCTFTVTSSNNVTWERTMTASTNE
ncbi:MAG: hypothetical protein IJ468_01385 [Lachnospiraceae bacterium]|nr:hypothetical protein [Lachnospiraceae bacterium]